MIYEIIEKDIIAAMKTNGTNLRDALRFLKSKIQTESIDSRKEIDDDLCISCIKKLIKQNEETLKFIPNGENLYLQDKCEIEIEIWRLYLPKMLDEKETVEAVESLIKELNITSIKQMGQVMGELKKKYGQTIDMGIVSKIVKEKLQ
jgi:uncharacterized protein YqeY